MRIAYHARDLPDAQLIADLLAQAGIGVRVLNQNAQSLAGEIPVTVAGPQVWVVDDALLSRARRLIDEHVSQPDPGSRHCRHCAEENPANFLTCWRCGGWV